MIFEAYGCEKTVYLFDTFSEMTQPADSDWRITDGASAKQEMENIDYLCIATLDDVKKISKKHM